MIECSEKMKSLLMKEDRWTPKSFRTFGVLIEEPKVFVPTFGPCIYREFNLTKPKKDRATHPKGTTATLFGNLNPKNLILLEGEWDLFAAFENGITNVICGTNGASCFTDEMAELIAGKNISIVYDNDKAGRDGAEKAADVLKRHQCWVRVISLCDHVPEKGDVRDFLTVCGKSGEELIHLINSVPYEEPVELGAQLAVQKLSNVEMKDVEFLWTPRIPRGAPTIIVGAPGVGKSFLVAWLAKHVSLGLPLVVDQSEFVKGNVLIFNMEDSVESTIKKRVSDAGADEDAVFVINEKVVLDQTGQEKIRNAVKENNPALVIFDPISSFLGSKTNVNAANEVREKMEFFITLAREFNVAVVCVMHTNKNEMGSELLNRVMGSIDFIGAVRSVMMVLKHPNDESIKLLGHIKANLTAPASTLSYRITDGKFVDVFDSSDKSLEQIRDQLLKANKNRLALEEAKNFLVPLLADGPKLVSEVNAEAKILGVSNSSIRRLSKDFLTKKRISLPDGKRGDGYWIVFLKSDEARFNNLSHLDLVERFDFEKSKSFKPNHQDDQDDHFFETEY